jgi:hypothetical protein
MPANSDENRSIADRISLTIAATSDPRGLFCDFDLAYLPISPYEFASAGIAIPFLLQSSVNSQGLSGISA